jgi:hypothetical protein
MKHLSAFLVAICLAGAGPACLAQAPGGSQQAPVVRAPFTLRLKLDNNRYYEENFTRLIPYVADNNIYLFAGESFGLKVGIRDGEIGSVAYRKESSGADVELQFRQFVTKDGLAIMMLMIRNNLKKTLYLDAVMTNPGDSNLYKTSIRPVGAGQTSYETWAQPIIQLKLANLRFKPQIGY